jgi:regulator of nonsense transcripts 3
LHYTPFLDNNDLVTVADIQPPALPTTTPLLEALKAEKSAQKDKEAILRNHAHYKDMNAAAIHGSTGSKREDKKKPAQPNNPPKGGDPPPSKKAAKKAAAAAKAAAQASTSAAAAPVKDGSAHPAGASNPPAKAKAPPIAPKAQRANRERKESKSSTQQATNQQPPTIISEPSPQNPQVSSPNPSTSDLPSSGPSSGPVNNPARRGRPVIGLGSRHFEAALSGAVGGKPKRERPERDGGKDSSTSTNASPAAATTSPKVRLKHVSSTTAPAAPPTILQRDPQGNANPAGIITRPQHEAAGTTQPVREDGAGGSGRGHRGRGRGRGGRGARGG